MTAKNDASTANTLKRYFDDEFNFVKMYYCSHPV